MTFRTPASSWQTILADLCLILFLVTASALANAPDAPLEPDGPRPVPRAAAPRAPVPPRLPTPVQPSQRGVPVGLWTDAPGAPPLAQWLDNQARDPRLRVTIAVRYARQPRSAAMAHAVQLGEAAGPRAASARMVVEPGTSDGAVVSLGYDAEDAGTQIAIHGA